MCKRVGEKADNIISWFVAAFVYIQTSVFLILCDYVTEQKKKPSPNLNRKRHTDANKAY